MKETQHIEPDQVEIVKQVQHKKHTKLIGRVLPHSGHTCFELNKKTLQLRKAVFEKTDVVFGSTAKPHKKVKINEGCIYITALNAKNAIKKLIKRYKLKYVIDTRE